jgi:hypothetical protein
MKQNMPKTWRLKCTLLGRGMQCIMGVILALLPFMLFCPSVNAVGPYAVSSNTVIDKGTGLEWQKHDDGTSRDWQNALAYCENLSLNSRTDWRLPNIRELKSIVDVSRYYPAVDPVFPSRLAYYWSATSVANYPSTSAWTVSFANGDDNWYVKTDRYYVRCIRAGISSSQPK